MNEPLLILAYLNLNENSNTLLVKTTPPIYQKAKINKLFLTLHFLQFHIIISKQSKLSMSDFSKQNFIESDPNIPKAKMEYSCLLTASTKLVESSKDPYDSSLLAYRLSFSDNKENNFKGKKKERLSKNNKGFGFVSVPKFFEAKENFQFPDNLDLARGVLQRKKLAAVDENQDDPTFVTDLLTKKLKLD